MPQVILIVAALLVAGCATGPSGRTSVPEHTDGGSIDLTVYVKDGFLLTPYSYTAPHQPIAVVDISVWPEARRKTTGARSKSYAVDTSRSAWESDVPNVYEALDQVRAEMAVMGADAIADLKISIDRKKVGGIAPGDGASCTHDGRCELQIVGIRIQGFALKRIDDPIDEPAPETPPAAAAPADTATPAEGQAE